MTTLSRFRHFLVKPEHTRRSHCLRRLPKRSIIQHISSSSILGVRTPPPWIIRYSTTSARSQRHASKRSSALLILVVELTTSCTRLLNNLENFLNKNFLLLAQTRRRVFILCKGELVQMADESASIDRRSSVAVAAEQCCLVITWLAGGGACALVYPFRR